MRMLTTTFSFTGFIASILLLSAANCERNNSGNGTGNGNQGPGDVEYWMTKADQTILFQKQTTALSFGTSGNSYSSIDVDSTQSLQSVDGFGYTLTGGSAYLINRMNATEKN